MTHRPEHWFKHDINSRAGLKMTAFLAKHGALGYGLFWIITEEMYRAPGHGIAKNGKLWQSIALAMRCDVCDVCDIRDTLCDLELWFCDDGFVYSYRVNEATTERNVRSQELSEKRREAGRRGNEKRWAANRKSSQTVANVARLDKKRVEEKRDHNTNTIGPDQISMAKPPEARELRPLVFLTDAQIEKLLTEMGRRELNYWTIELSEHAQQNEKAWKKKYKNHLLVIKNWRRRKLERGMVWLEAQGRYGYPDMKRDTRLSSSEAQIQKNLEILKQIEEMENEN
jgi:hypothetical protein